MARRVCTNFIISFIAYHTGAIDITDIAATEYVAVAVGKSFIGTYLTTVDMHLGLTKHIAVGVERTRLTVAIDIVALATTEHIALHVAVEHLDMGLTGLIEACQSADGIAGATRRDSTTTDGSNLTTTMYTVTNDTVPYLHVGLIDTASDIISATKQITTVGQTSVRYKDTLYLVRLVFYHWIVAGRQASFYRICMVAIANVAVVQGKVSLAKHGTTLATTIGITLNGRQATIESIVVFRGVTA